MRSNDSQIKEKMRLWGLRKEGSESGLFDVDEDLGASQGNASPEPTFADFFFREWIFLVNGAIDWNRVTGFLVSRFIPVEDDVQFRR